MLNTFKITNASSHSVSIGMNESKEFLLDTIYPDQDGIITITGDEFGWEWFKHNDAGTKATYAAQQFMYNDDSLETLKEVIMEQTGADDVIFEDLENGYVDHDSVGIIENHKSFLRDFIFNKNSWLFGGNDNSTPDPTFYDVPEFKDGKMVLPKYKYELMIEGLVVTTKFKKKPNLNEIDDAVRSLLDGYVLIGSAFVEDNFMWAINRAPGTVHELSWKVEQDYSKNEILFMRKDDNAYYNLENHLKNTGVITDDMNYIDRRNIVRKELEKIPDTIKGVKFEIREL